MRSCAWYQIVNTKFFTAPGTPRRVGDGAPPPVIERGGGGVPEQELEGSE